jgi:hypothetical protein
MVEKNHPVWGILRTAVMFGGLTLLLWVNADHFDITEIKTILELLGLKIAYEVGRRRITKA